MRIVGAPGYEDFEATIVPGLRAVKRPNGDTVTVVIDKNNEIFVFDVQYVKDI